jgi:hypothetical protein
LRDESQYFQCKYDEMNAGRQPYSLTWTLNMDGNIATATLPNSFAEVKGFNTCTAKTTCGANPDSPIKSGVLL